MRGFCWALSHVGSDPLCSMPEHHMWNQAPVHHQLDLSSIDFEFSFRGGQGAIDAWQWHTATVGTEVAAGHWPVRDMAAWLRQTDIPEPVGI